MLCDKKKTDGGKEVYISDLAALAAEKERLSAYSSKDKWECVSYETAYTKGTMLIASSESRPEPVTISPALSGWYRIYLCTGDFGGATRVDVKLSGDEFPTTVSPCRMGQYSMWTNSENVEEAFWKCADMTGRTVTVSKPDVGFKSAAALLWLRFVPMSAEEVGEFKNTKPVRRMIAHMDGDFHGNYEKHERHDYCRAIYAMKDSDVGIICQEVMNDLCGYEFPGGDYAFRDEITKTRYEYFKKLTADRYGVYKDEIDYAHEFGIKLFAAHRMQLSDFAFPFTNPIFSVPFVVENRDKRCEARDGTAIDFLSYGYKEVQDFMINCMLESAKQGFDGVLNIWTRGMHLLFEKPVRERFKEKYGKNVDMRTLLEDDPRLTGTKSDIMTEFYRRMRRALSDFAAKNGKEPLKIYITGCFDVQSSLRDGIDIERLAKEGLIDGVIQTKMKVTELTDGVLDGDGLIDIEKYKEKAKRERMFDRVTGSFIDLLAEGTKEYRRIADEYGIDYHTEIQWETYKKAEEYVNGAKQIYSAYGKGISLWDCYPCRVNSLSEWAAVSRLGDREKVLSMSEEPSAYHRIIKVLSYNGSDVRYYNPSWRG